ncbi:MAG: cytochrome b/b6 domain-containing protein [Thermodesulfobacteriota bacterium]
MSASKLRRFSLAQRLFHLGLLLCFVCQAATGLARMYVETAWGRGLTAFFGGHDQALNIHKTVGIVLIIIFVVHAVYILVRFKWSEFPAVIFSPDSILPRPADLGQFVRHTLWLLGLGRPPRIDRWTYWEKFDYWAVFWGMVIIGGSGLILYDPVITSRLMPGWIINPAFWVHRIEAILAMGHVFIIHFFVAHGRRHNFPMDTAMFEGSVSLDLARYERPAWMERLEQSGELTRILVNGASMPLRVLYYGFGLTVMAFCLFLLVGAMINAGGVSW